MQNMEKIGRRRRVAKYVCWFQLLQVRIMSAVHIDQGVDSLRLGVIHHWPNLV